MPGGKRATVAVPGHPQDDRPVAAPGPEEVSVQRVGQPPFGHRVGGRPQGLRGDLTAEQLRPLRGDALVDAPVEVGVELLQIEEPLQLVDHAFPG